MLSWAALLPSTLHLVQRGHSRSQPPLKNFKHMKRNILLNLAMLSSWLILDFQYNDVFADHQPAVNLMSTPKVELGRMLFFDKILSGNKDISCATCHHPGLASADGLPLSIGVGGQGLGKERKMGVDREHIPRNSPDIFNRGAKEWHTMFWDGRVAGSAGEGFDTPAEEKLPDGLENILAAQAMFPVISRDEMRGEIGDRDVNGQINELALISDASPQIIWHRIMLRILEIPDYRALFQAVYPDVKLEELGFQHAANAIAAFEAAAFTFADSPWDRYQAGETSALSPAAQKGASLFFGPANCSSCHNGPLFTDQQHHNIGIPQLGPGKGSSQPLDLGRFLESGDPKDLFAFRTPPLKNTAITGPWMHNGAFYDLEQALRHHLNPQAGLENYDCLFLEDELGIPCRNSDEVIHRLLANLDPGLAPREVMTDQNIKELVSFLHALTDSSAVAMSELVPDAVPSGLSVID